MKTVIASAILGISSLAILGGCQSNHESDVKSTFRSQYVTVGTDVRTTTDIAKSVLMDKGMKSVSGDSTMVDGKVKAKKADGTDVNVFVTKEDAGTRVQVTVGMMGGPDLGSEIAHAIKEKADMGGMMPMKPATMGSDMPMR